MYISSIDRTFELVGQAPDCSKVSDSDLDFWTKRAQKYNRLQWAVNDQYLENFLHAGLFNKNDIVLDIGTGTGIIANELSNHVKFVYGVDISVDMLSQAASSKKENQEFVVGDASCLPFENDKFSKITARMVFHHLIGKTEAAINECHRVLAKDGLLILSEGVPPDKCVEQFYKDIFALKEERLTFFEEDLTELMQAAGFNEVKVHEFYFRKASVKNWLENSGLDAAVQKQIFDMHVNLHEAGREAYNMEIIDNDVLIDMKFLICVGRKS